MPDYLKIASPERLITSDIIRTSRTPTLTQLLNQALDGTLYIQTIGSVHYTVSIRCIIHEDNDSLLYSAYQNGDAILVSDDDKVYVGYITRLIPSDKYAEGYREWAITMQEEVVT